MNSRRTIILVGALVAGVLAALLLFQYVGGIEDRANGDAQMVSVVVAKGQISRGAAANDLIAAKVIDMGQRRKVELPANAVARPEEIKGQLAQINIEPGTIITSSMFASEAMTANSVSAALKPGMVAVTTSVDQIHSVAGLITQGDYVNLTIQGQCTLTQEGEPAVKVGGDASGGGEGAKPDEVKTCTGSMYQKVRILALGRSLGSSVATPVAASGEAGAVTTTTAPASDLITFELPPEAAQAVAASGPGSLYLSLVRKDYQPVPLPVNENVPLKGVAGQTPYGADPEASPAGQ
ncbi:MAG: Flp pilus assembly protein CpaB [Microthrixaceae bacterium]